MGVICQTKSKADGCCVPVRSSNAPDIVRMCRLRDCVCEYEKHHRGKVVLEVVVARGGRLFGDVGECMAARVVHGRPGNARPAGETVADVTTGLHMRFIIVTKKKSILPRAP